MVWPEYGRSPLENMKMIREICGNYAHTFGQRSGKNPDIVAKKMQRLIFPANPGEGRLSILYAQLVYRKIGGKDCFPAAR